MEQEKEESKQETPTNAPSIDEESRKEPLESNPAAVPIPTVSTEGNKKEQEEAGKHKESNDTSGEITRTPSIPPSTTNNPERGGLVHILWDLISVPISVHTNLPLVSICQRIIELAEQFGYIASFKCFNRSGSNNNMTSTVKQSLQELGIEYEEINTEKPSIESCIVSNILQLVVAVKLQNSYIESAIPKVENNASINASIPRPVLILITDDRDFSRSLSICRRSALLAEVILLHAQKESQYNETLIHSVTMAVDFYELLGVTPNTSGHTTITQQQQQFIETSTNNANIVSGSSASSPGSNNISIISEEIRAQQTIGANANIIKSSSSSIESFGGITAPGGMCTGSSNIIHKIPSNTSINSSTLSATKDEYIPIRSQSFPPNTATNTPNTSFLKPWTPEKDSNATTITNTNTWSNFDSTANFRSSTNNYSNTITNPVQSNNNPVAAVLAERSAQKARTCIWAFQKVMAYCESEKIIPRESVLKKRLLDSKIDIDYEEFANFVCESGYAVSEGDPPQRVLWPRSNNPGALEPRKFACADFFQPTQRLSAEQSAELINWLQTYRPEVDRGRFGFAQFLSQHGPKFITLLPHGVLVELVQLLLNQKILLFRKGRVSVATQIINPASVDLNAAWNNNTNNYNISSNAMNYFDSRTRYSNSSNNSNLNSMNSINEEAIYRQRSSTYSSGSASIDGNGNILNISNRLRTGSLDSNAPPFQYNPSPSRGSIINSPYESYCNNTTNSAPTSPNSYTPTLSNTYLTSSSPSCSTASISNPSVNAAAMAAADAIIGTLDSGLMRVPTVTAPTTRAFIPNTILAQDAEFNAPQLLYDLSVESRLYPSPAPLTHIYGSITAGYPSNLPIYHYEQTISATSTNIASITGIGSSNVNQSDMLVCVCTIDIRHGNQSDLSRLKRFKSTLRKLKEDAKQEAATRTLEASLWTLVFNKTLVELKKKRSKLIKYISPQELKQLEESERISEIENEQQIMRLEQDSVAELDRLLAYLNQSPITYTMEASVIQNYRGARTVWKCSATIVFTPNNPSTSLSALFSSKPTTGSIITLNTYDNNTIEVDTTPIQFSSCSARKSEAKQCVATELLRLLELKITSANWRYTHTRPRSDAIAGFNNNNNTNSINSAANSLSNNNAFTSGNGTTGLTNSPPRLRPPICRNAASPNLNISVSTATQNNNNNANAAAKKEFVGLVPYPATPTIPPPNPKPYNPISSMNVNPASHPESSHEYFPNDEYESDINKLLE